MDNKYRLSAKEYFVCLSMYMGIVSSLAYLFYDSVLAFVAMLPFFFLFLRYEKKQYYSRYKEELDREFLKSLQSMTSSLAAGFSPENAFIKTQSDMSRMFGKHSIIVKELNTVNKQIACGKSVEEALDLFANRTNNRSIKEFTMIFNIANVSGGDFAKVLSSCVNIMNATNEAKEEARVLVRGKEYEQRIMSIIPLGILLYLKFSSGSFIGILYHNILGILIMTGCLILYILSIYISRKIIEVEV